MSRPRRTAAAAAAATADPEFLALSSRQKRSIDRAFARGVEVLQRKSKRRKLDLPVDHGKGKEVDVGEAAGGFMDDDGDGPGGFLDDAGEGGFVDDAAGGGFMDDAGGGGGGGFMLEDDGLEGGFIDEPTTSTTRSRSRMSTSPPTTTSKARIPLYILPGLLTSLGLPSDEDVLAVFKASASGWEDQDDHHEQERFRKRGLGQDEGEEEQLGVELKDFRAVCAALMDPESEHAGDDDDGGHQDGEVPGSIASEEGSEFGSELSSLDSDSEYGGSSKSKSKSRVKATDYTDESHSTAKSAKRPKRGGKKMRALEEEGKPKLSSKQKELVKDLWEMLKTPLTSSTSKTRGTDANVLGRDQVKSHIRALGEMWTDDEITEMVTLFSTQHQGRGLSYDDFGVVMLRAGLV